MIWSGEFGDKHDRKSQGKYSYEPVISCLEAVTFFRVSKLTHRRPERQCNPARDRNPAKGKPLLRQGTDGNSEAQWT